tara:strand:+ start:387 stop:491 length:105 start_codon:yes stop_codon:yes gene_type:complete
MSILDIKKALVGTFQGMLKQCPLQMIMGVKTYDR